VEKRYYTDELEAWQFERVVYIGLNEELDPPKQLPNGFDIDAAFKKCVWFKREASYAEHR
jgi:hypothetical protein